MSKIQVVWFRDLTRWDTKNYMNQLQSRFPLKPLREFIVENTDKIKPFDFPQQKFDILGVTNKEGVYFNESLLGSQIKQPYYRVNSGDIFYNPYRVNVGSIGIVPQEFDGKFTSPAYVVFRTKKTELLAEYLVFILKSSWFNAHLRANTKGSVRQNLSFESLCELKIPLPPLEIQNNIVADIHAIQAKIKALQDEEKRLKDEIEAYIYIALGLSKPQITQKQKVFTVRFKDLERWDIAYNQGSYKQENNNAKLDKYHLQELCKINPSVDMKELIKQDKNVSFIPMERLETDGKSFTPLPKKASLHKGFTKFQNDDLLWAKITPCMQNKKSVVVNGLENGVGFGSTEFFVLRVKDSCKTDIQFILQILRTDLVIEQAKLHFKGSAGQQRVPKEFLENLQIPLPPLKIQKEIVAFVESKTTHISNLTQERTTLQNSIESKLQKMLTDKRKIDEIYNKLPESAK